MQSMSVATTIVHSSRSSRIARFLALAKLYERLLSEQRLEKSILGALSTLEQAKEKVEKKLERIKRPLFPSWTEDMTKPYGKIPKSFLPIRIRQRKSHLFTKGKKLIPLNKSIGLVLGRNKKADIYQVQSIEFNRNPDIGKVWSLPEAKKWVIHNKSVLKSFHVDV